MPRCKMMPAPRQSFKPAAPRKQSAAKIIYKSKSTSKVAVRQRAHFVGPFGRYLTFQGDNKPLVLRQLNNSAPEQRFRFITNDAATGLYKVKWFDPVTKISYQLYGMPGEDSALYAGKRPPTNASTRISIKSASGVPGVANPVTIATYDMEEAEEVYRWTGTEKYTVVLTLPVASNAHQLWTITPPLSINQKSVNESSDEESSDDDSSDDQDDSSDEENDGFDDSEPEFEPKKQKENIPDTVVESVVDQAVQKGLKPRRSIINGK